MIIKVRSPYFIEVNETGQVGSKIELFIWNNGQTEPVLGAVGTYVLAKPIPSISQIKNVYNISPFITEFIDNISPLDSVNNMSVNVKVKRYKETAINVYSLLALPVASRTLKLAFPDVLLLMSKGKYP